MMKCERGRSFEGTLDGARYKDTKVQASKLKGRKAYR